MVKYIYIGNGKTASINREIKLSSFPNVNKNDGAVPQRQNSLNYGKNMQNEHYHIIQYL